MPHSCPGGLAEHSTTFYKVSPSHQRGSSKAFLEPDKPMSALRFDLVMIQDVVSCAASGLQQSLFAMINGTEPPPDI